MPKRSSVSAFLLASILVLSAPVSLSAQEPTPVAAAVDVDALEGEAIALLDDEETTVSLKLERAEQIVSIIPQSSDAWSALGELRMEAGEDEAALLAFGRAVEKDPKAHTSWHWIGVLRKREKRDLAGALDAFRKALDAGAPRARGLNEIGVTLALMGRMNEALQTWEEAIAADPKWGVPCANAVNASIRLGEEKKAKSFFDMALKAERFEISAAVFWSIHLIEDGKPDKAAAELSRALVREPESPTLNYYYGEALRANGDKEAAIEALKLAMDSAKESGDDNIYGAAQKALFASEHPKDLKKLIKAEKLITEVSSNPKSQAKDLGEAIETLDDIIAKYPYMWEPFLLRGIAHRRLGHLEEARGDISRVLEELPEQPNAIINMAMLHRDQGEMDKAAELSRQAIEIAPSDPAVLLNAGFILVDAGDCASAKRLYQQARELVPAEDIEGPDPLEPLAAELSVTCP